MTKAVTDFVMMSHSRPDDPLFAHSQQVLGMISSPVIEATDEDEQEEHDQGVYGVHKSLPLSDNSPVNDDSGHGGSGPASHHGSSNLPAPAAMAPPYQSSDSNLYSLDDDALLLDEDEEIEFRLHNNIKPTEDASTLNGSLRTVQYFSADLNSPPDDDAVFNDETANRLERQTSFSSKTSSTRTAIKKHSSSSSTRSTRRCQCAECQMLEHQLDNMYSHDVQDESVALLKARKSSRKKRNSGGHGPSHNKIHAFPPSSLVLGASGRSEVHPSLLERVTTSSPPPPNHVELIQAGDALSMSSQGVMEAILNRDVAAPPLFYAIRDGVIFQPGLPPSLSFNSLHDDSQAAPKQSRRWFGASKSPDRPKTRSKQRRHRRSKRSRKKTQKTSHSPRHRSMPPAPKSSPTVASRHFGADTGGYPMPTAKQADKALAEATLLNMGSFRIMIERIKRWFVHKSRRIWSPRYLFSATGMRRSSSSLPSSLHGSRTSLALSSSGSTSLCDSNPSITDMSVQVPPLVPKGSRRDSVSSSDSANSLLEFKRKVGKQRRERAEKERQERLRANLQPRMERQRRYLEVHAKNGPTVTSTISCPTGPGGVPVGRRGKRRLVTAGTLQSSRGFLNQDPSTASMMEMEHASLQLSASWPLIDRLPQRLRIEELNAPAFSQAERTDIDGNEDDFFNEPSGPALATMAERRAGWRHHLAQQTQDSARDSVCSDCAIPFQDLEFADCVRDSDGHKIFSGRWYGTVMIHLFSGFTDRDVGAFWSEVHKIMTLRHDNVALFMGAAVERSALAIVISVQTHLSLFDQIHLTGTSMAPSVLTIGRQLAQGMGYLHSRNIVLGHLNSRNVFIDGKLKISMADCSKPKRDSIKHDSACLSRGVATYLAPELLRSLSIVPQQQHINLPPRICFHQGPTTDTDVYAFGTLLFEVAFNEFPFSGEPLEVVIFQTVSGCRAPFDEDSFSLAEQAGCSAGLFSGLRQLIEDCWCHDPLSRPMFKDIYRLLQVISSQGLAAEQQQRRKCSSVPERLNQLSSRAGAIAYY